MKKLSSNGLQKLGHNIGVYGQEILLQEHFQKNTKGRNDIIRKLLKKLNCKKNLINNVRALSFLFS